MKIFKSKAGVAFCIFAVVVVVIALVGGWYKLHLMNKEDEALKVKNAKELSTVLKKTVKEQGVKEERKAGGTKEFIVDITKVFPKEGDTFDVEYSIDSNDGQPLNPSIASEIEIQVEGGGSICGKAEYTPSKDGLHTGVKQCVKLSNSNVTFKVVSNNKQPQMVYAQRSYMK